VGGLIAMSYLYASMLVTVVALLALMLKEQR